MTEPKNVGSLNGPWARAFKFGLVTTPFVLASLLALNVWMVTSIYDHRVQLAVMEQRLESFMAVGPRFTPQDAKAAHLELWRDLYTYIDKHVPPAWFQDIVESLEARVTRLENRSS